MKTQTTIRVEETNYHKAKQIHAQTKKALKELDEKKGETFSSVDALFDDLDS